MSSRRVFIESIAGVTLSAVAPQVAAAQRRTGAPGRRIIVLDVNETMLDIRALEPHFARVFGSGDILREWFSTLLLYSNVASLAGPYAEFGAIANAALDMVASARGVTVATADRDAILRGMRTLPAHADVRGGLERLRQAGFRLVTLTNSAPAVVKEQLASAGLADLFERSFSVDAVKRFKPAPEPYQYVARELGVSTAGLRLVAAHAWDVVGALRAGCSAALLTRPGKVVYPLGPLPDIVAPDLVAAAEKIVLTDTSER